MRTLLFVGWLFVGLAGIIFHYGPGQEKMTLDQVDSILREARQAAENEKWNQAIEQFDQVLALLPSDRRNEQRWVRLEKAKAQMMASQLPVARQALAGLLDELESDETAEPKLKSETRSALASAQYYMTWLMRLEGLPKTEWEPEIESARQNYRILFERATQAGDEALAKRSQEDLESAVRLARIDLKELQGLPLPNQ